MAIDLNDEIVQDFLVEAGEILESLNEQLVDLESRPDDKELLNSVFRSFHTIKGGAGFLAMDPLVEVCHKAENIFDLLRNDERSVDSELMDIVLEVLDVVNDMFSDIGNGNDPNPASAELLENLNRLSQPETASPEVIEHAPEVTGDNEIQPTSTGTESDDINDEEFEGLLDQLHGSGKPTSADGEENKAEIKLPEAKNNEITDDEFEGLLDQLQGSGKQASGVKPKPETKPTAKNDDITDNEFEDLLDQLQGKKTGTSDTKKDSAALSEPTSVVTEISEVKKSVEKTAAVQSAEAKLNKADKTESKTTKVAVPKAETTVRVETSILDHIMNMVGELVLLRNRLSTLETTLSNEEVTETVGNLDVVTTDLQSAVMKTRMQPIKKVFGRFPRVVRDLARSLDKQITLEMIGEETDLDKNLVEALADPLVHLVRNSVDHGIEMPDERVAVGKNKEGTVVLSAEQEGDHILLTIQDDGKGMDHEVLRKKAVEKGLFDEDSVARLDESDCYNLIFMPGFSTKEEISDVSGRGVGMDVVKTRINQLNGTVSVDSKLGFGTTIEIKVPLTLAIMPTLMVKLGEKDQVFALPLVSVNEILDLDMNKVNMVDGQKVVVIRGKPLPLFYLSTWLTTGSGDYDLEKGHVVVVTIGTHMIALLVDSLLGREEVVIKPLGAMLHGTKGLAGATITGNGKIALILDLPDLLKSYANRY